MNPDIRVSTAFRGHRKLKRLVRRLGPGAGLGLVCLWIGAAIARPDGVLTGWTAEDIADEATFYDGDPDEFVKALIDCKFLEVDDDGVYVLHDWNDHQGWVSGSEDRSNRSRLAALVKKHGRAKAVEIAQDKYGIDPAEYGYDIDSKQPRPKESPPESAGGTIRQCRKVPAADSGSAPSPSPFPLPSPLPSPDHHTRARARDPDDPPATRQETEPEKDQIGKDEDPAPPKTTSTTHRPRDRPTQGDYRPPPGDHLKIENPWLDCKAWDDFVEHRGEIKKPLTRKAVEKSLNLLRRYPHQQQEIVDSSIRSQWTGLFAPKGNNLIRLNAGKKTREQRIATTLQTWGRMENERENQDKPTESNTFPDGYLLQP